MLSLSSRRSQGDTIVEVLLAIAIAAFTIGITYTTAQHSLDQSITARERNQALNLIENQITDLRIRYQKDPANFNNNFGSQNHFCLDDSATTIGPNPPWRPYPNSGSGTEATTLNGGGNPYNSSAGACVRNVRGDGVTYYLDVQTGPIVGQTAIVFQVFARWERVGGGPINQASLFFRPNGATNQSFGYAPGYSLAKIYEYKGKLNES